MNFKIYHMKTKRQQNVCWKHSTKILHTYPVAVMRKKNYYNTKCRLYTAYMQ